MSFRFTTPDLTRFNLKLWLCALGLSFLCYLPSLQGPFILDDAHTVQSNDAIQNPANFFKLWTSARYYSSSPDNWGYRPMQAMYTWTSWQLGQGETWPFHAFKILFFSFVATFFTLIWRRLLPELPATVILLGGLFFLVNPVHTQVVSYIAATSTLLAGMFVTFSLYQYLRFREDGRWWRWAISVIGVFFAMMSKEEGITILGMIPLIEIYLRYREGRLRFGWRDLGVYLGYVVSGALALALIISMFEPTSDLARGSMDRWIYFATQFRAYLRYMAMYFVSYDLNADNLQFGFATSWRDTSVILSVAANLILLTVAIFYIRRAPLLALCLFWFFGAISPASSILVLAEPVNDHRAFLAYLGFAGLSFPLIHWLRQKGVVGRAFVALVIVGYAGWTMARNVTWSSNVNLWEDTIAKNPDSVRAHNNAALNYMHRSEWDRAAQILDACLAIEPRYSYCLINRALVGVSRGEEQLSESLYKRAIEADFAGVNARRYYAEFMFARGRLTEAIPYAEQADQAAQGKNLFVRTLLIRLHLNTGNKSRAREILNESLETFGNDPSLIGLQSAL